MTPHHDSSDHGSSDFRRLSAFFHIGAHLRLWSVAVAGLAFDLWSKSWAFENLQPADVRQVIPGVLTFRRSINPGALFGMGEGLVPLFIVASFVALGFVLYLFASSTADRRSLHLALSFVLAGSLGNLYDRAMISADQITFKAEVDHPDPRPGTIIEDDPASEYLAIGQAPDGAPPVQRIRREDIASVSKVGIVRDFLKIEPKIAGRDIWPWVFNVADSLLVVGVIILMLNFWYERVLHRKQNAPTEPSADPT